MLIWGCNNLEKRSYPILKQITLFLLVVLPELLPFQLFAQQAPDFEVTDVNGELHQLYDDYLNEGRAVVLGLFYIGAPMLDDMYPQLQEYANLADSQALPVNFLLMSAFDDNSEIIAFAESHGISLPVISNEGGASAAIAPYTAENDFGTFYGYPMFVVIGPDGTVVYDPWAGDVDGVIEAVGEAVNEVLSNVSVADTALSGALRIARTRNGVTFSHPALSRGAKLQLYLPDGQLYTEIALFDNETFIPLEPRALLIYRYESGSSIYRGRLPLLQ